MRDNPAQRLHDLLVALRDEPRNEMLRDVWARYLGTAPSNLPVLLRAAADTTALPGQVTVRLKEVVPAEDLELSLRWQAPVVAAMQGFQSMLNIDLDGVRRQYDNETLLSLKYASRELRASSREISDGDLADLARSLDELVEQVQAARLPVEFRLFMLDGIAEMQRAIRYITITGAEGLDAALARAVGSIFLVRTTDPQAAQTDAWQGFEKCTSRLNGIMQFGSTVAAIAGQAQQAIGTVASVLGLS